MENLCSEILIAEPRSTFYPKNIFVESDTTLSCSPTERKQLQISVYHFNTSWLHRASNNVETFSLPTDAHNVKKHRVIKTF